MLSTLPDRLRGCGQGPPLSSIRFSRQVWPGDTLTCRGKVTGKTEKNGEKLVEGDVEVVNQKGETTVKGNFTVLAGLIGAATHPASELSLRL